MDFSNVVTGIKSVMRVGQTAQVLGVTGFSWLMGERPPTPVLLRETFEKLGTTYIKLGQFVASSPSIFPEEYVNEFQKCLDNTEIISFDQLVPILEQELGRPMYEVYSSIDSEPLASASIAQVHAATLLSGEDVVVKIQKPGVQNILLTDFNFMYIAARVVERFAPGFSASAISGIVEEIESSMLKECDFVEEANNLEQFAEFLDTSNNLLATVPKVYRGASSRRVLTMERFYGVPLTDLEAIKKYSDNPAETLSIALNTWFSSLMSCDFFHADVHAGNLMVLKDGRVGFIDFGIVGRISQTTWKGMLAFFEAISQGDYLAMADAMLLVGMTKETVDTTKLADDLAGFYRSMSAVNPGKLTSTEQDSSNVNKLLMDLVSIGEKHGIRFPREFALLVKQFLYFDRYVQALAPNMNMFDDVRLDMLMSDDREKEYSF